MLFLVVGMALVFPLAIYCLILASLNRGRQPIVVPGPWDFAEVLFAASGFLLFGGPCAITNFNSRWREFWLTGNAAPLKIPGLPWVFYWASVLALYFLIVLGASGYLLWRRRLATAIYNIEAAVLLENLGKILDRLRLDWCRCEQRFFIGARSDQLGPAPETAGDDLSTGNGHTGESPNPTTGQSQGRLDNRKRVLEVDAFPAMRHVTLYWPADAGPLRDEVENELAQTLEEVQTENNPVSPWMVSLATCLFSVMIFTLVYLVVSFRR